MMTADLHRVSVALETPRHAALGACLSYRSEQPLAPGTLLRVPLGRREVPGLVWDAERADAPALPEGSELREVADVFDALPPLPADWRALVNFAAAYYQRGVGELAMAVLPPELRKMDSAALERRITRLKQRPAPVADAQAGTAAGAVPPVLAADQLAALEATAAGVASADSRPLLLHGVTGSGKTEVYLHAAAMRWRAGSRRWCWCPRSTSRRSSRRVSRRGFRAACWSACTAASRRRSACAIGCWRTWAWPIWCWARGWPSLRRCRGWA
jgi:primosomal protein N' (replication factor Y)